MDYDLLLPCTLLKIEDSKLISDIIKIKLDIKMNPNFSKESKSFALGYAQCKLNQLHKEIF